MLRSLLLRRPPIARRGQRQICLSLPCFAPLSVPVHHHQQVVKTASLRMLERARLQQELIEDDVDPDGARRRGKRIKQLEPLFESWTTYQGLQAALEESLPLLDDPDPSLRSLAQEEIVSLRTSLSTLLSSTLPQHLLPPSSSAHLSAIVELKSGQGGSEASLFTGQMRDMFLRFASVEGYQAEVLEQTFVEGFSGGQAVREVTIRVKGEGAFGRLKFESGVHRVQRVPVTETKGRTHTSTMAVVVLPIDENPDKGDLSYIDPKDVRMEFLRSSGAGGQHVNKTESAVRLTHSKTGISVKCQEGRSQHANRETAWTILRGKVHAYRAKVAEEKQRSARESQIPGMDRADKIRTWNEPQDRVTDHRVPITFSNLQQILAGDRLSDVVDALGEWHLGKRLEALMAGEDADIND